jgi:hypothetical protein
LFESKYVKKNNDISTTKQNLKGDRHPFACRKEGEVVNIYIITGTAPTIEAILAYSFLVAFATMQQ